MLRKYECERARAGLWRGVLSLVAVSVALCAPRAARADAASCSKAHESGQQATRDGQLRKASELYTMCASDDSCPEVIRNDCIALRDETNQALPTVTFLVTDGSREISNVRVFADDQLLADGLDGRALALDPGRHRLKLLLPRGRVLSSEILLREGEKNRVITVQAGSHPPAADGEPSSSERDRIPPKREVPAALWVASGIGLSAIGVGTAFALLGRSQEQQVVDCSPSCAPALRSNLENARRDYLVANIAFGVAGASAATALALYLTLPSATKPPPVVSSLRLRQVAIVPSSRGLQASAGFSFQAL